MPMTKHPRSLIPMVPACGEIGVTYLRGRNLALSGVLELHWVAGKMYVTKESVEKFKAQQSKQPVGAR